MDRDALTELRTLQERAYGPDGDIHVDPDALRRLEELQAGGAGGPTDAASTDEALDSSPAQPDDAAADSAGGEDSAASDPEPAPPAPTALTRRLRRWMPWLWVASLIVVAAIASLWTFTSTIAVFAPIRLTAEGARQVAVLQVDPGFVAPGFFASSAFDLVGFEEFHGMTVVTTAGEWPPGSNDEKCLWIARTDTMSPGSDSVTGPLYNDCGAGDFPTSVELTVTTELPEELRELYPEGTALQFVLDGSRVGVFTDAD